MWPWGHLAAGYLVYSAFCRFGAGRPLRDVPVLVALVGTQSPDLVDKPLAWTLSVLPTGRSLGHSVVVAVLVLPVLWWVAARRDVRPLATAFGLGYLTHLLTDALYPLVRLDAAGLAFLRWPLVPQPSYEESYGILEYFLTLEPSLTVLFELLLVGLASLVWHADGRPGLATIRSWPDRLLAAVRS